MGITISNKAIILMDFEKIFPLVNEILAAINIDYYSDGSSLSSMTSLLKRISEEQNLTFLKRDILSFIQKNGYPFITIIGMNIKTGLAADADKTKALKTLLLSYIIILQSEQYKSISCNLLIPMSKEDYLIFKETYKQSQNILSLLKTNDDRINNIINEYITNSEKFKRSFNILVTDADQEPSLLKSELILFINMIKAKEKLKNKIIPEKQSPLSGPKINAAPPADVVLRAGKNYFKNGESPSIYDEHMDLTDKEIYILGNFTSFTRLNVMERLLSLIKRGFGNEFNLKKGGPLTLNIPKESIIDSTTPITLAQLLSKELLDYKNIKIKTTTTHYQMMQQAKGFSMIQHNLIIDDV